MVHYVHWECRTVEEGFDFVDDDGYVGDGVARRAWPMTVGVLDELVLRLVDGLTKNRIRKKVSS